VSAQVRLARCVGCGVCADGGVGAIGGATHKHTRTRTRTHECAHTHTHTHHAQARALLQGPSLLRGSSPAAAEAELALRALLLDLVGLLRAQVRVELMLRRGTFLASNMRSRLP